MAAVGGKTRPWSPRRRGSTWGPRRPLIHRGRQYDEEHWGPGLYYGKNGGMHSAGFIKLADGTILHSLAVELEDGRQMLQFRLELSKKGLLSRPVAVPLSIEAAAQMRHLPDCPHGRGSPRTGRQQTRKRRKRKR